jgi:hypothetical protein
VIHGLLYDEFDKYFDFILSTIRYGLTEHKVTAVPKEGRKDARTGSMGGSHKSKLFQKLGYRKELVAGYKRDRLSGR